MTDQRKTEPKAEKPGVEEKVGRTLGKALGRLKKSKVWKDTTRAYQDGLEGKR